MIPELGAIKIDGFFGDFEPVECIPAGPGVKAFHFYILRTVFDYCWYTPGQWKSEPPTPIRATIIKHSKMQRCSISLGRAGTARPGGRAHRDDGGRGAGGLVDGAVDFMDILGPSPALALVLPPQPADGDGGGASLLEPAMSQIGDEIDDQLSNLQTELMTPPGFSAEVAEVIRERVPDNRRKTNNIMLQTLFKTCLVINAKSVACYTPVKSYA